MKKWYAVLKNREDTDWGTGSFDLKEAIEMMKVYGEDSLIAVIDNGDDPVCIDEITWEDI